jgi:radical SAM protein with 4Fe4S-binding SPASM domain
MNSTKVSSIPLSRFPLWEKIQGKRIPVSFILELTARCNLNCRHCYINLPAGDCEARSKELSFTEIKTIVDDAVSLGALSCLITGGEPLLRQDFEDIYAYMKKKGLLVSIFTNATLISEKILQLFHKYPPRDMEISVYGASKSTYEQITRTEGSFPSFQRGLETLETSDVKMTLKTMVMKSNFHELPAIRTFCRKHTRGKFRFDPFLQLRYDRNTSRNKEIVTERLTPEEIARLECSDKERLASLQKSCDRLIVPDFANTESNRLLMCSAGSHSFTIGPDGSFRLCPSLVHTDCVYDLRQGSLEDAWSRFAKEVRELCSTRQEFLDNCRICPMINLCLWCPATAYLEVGKMDIPVDHFCELARARARALEMF